MCRAAAHPEIGVRRRIGVGGQDAELHRCDAHPEGHGELSLQALQLVTVHRGGTEMAHVIGRNEVVEVAAKPAFEKSIQRRIRSLLRSSAVGMSGGSA